MFEKGDPFDRSIGSYQLTAVWNLLPLVRLYAYANMLNSRLVFYLETLRLRADCQTGFRLGMSTAPQSFAAQHLIDAISGVYKPRLLAFLDLSKARDRVDHEQLWIIIELISKKRARAD